MCCTNAQCTAHVAGGTTIYASMGTQTSQISAATGTPAGQTASTGAGTFSPTTVPSSTTAAQATNTGSSESVSYPTAGNSNSNNMGTIIGAVVGGVGGIIVISLIIFCSMRYRRHHDNTAPPSQYTGQSRRTSRTHASRLPSGHAELKGSFPPTSPQTTLAAPDSVHHQSPQSKMVSRYSGSLRSGGSDGMTLTGPAYAAPMASVAESPVLGKGHMYSPALSAHTKGSPMASVTESPVLGLSQLAPVQKRNSQHSNQFSVKSNIERPTAARANSQHFVPVRARSHHFESPPALPEPTMRDSKPSPITNRDPAIGPAGRVQKRPCEVPADTSDYHRGQMHELE